MHHHSGYDVLGGYGESTRDSWSYSRGASKSGSSSRSSAISDMLSFKEFGDFKKRDKKKGYSTLEITKPGFKW